MLAMSGDQGLGYLVNMTYRASRHVHIYVLPETSGKLCAAAASLDYRRLHGLAEKKA